MAKKSGKRMGREDRVVIKQGLRNGDSAREITGKLQSNQKAKAERNHQRGFRWKRPFEMAEELILGSLLDDVGIDEVVFGPPLMPYAVGR